MLFVSACGTTSCRLSPVEQIARNDVDKANDQDVAHAHIATKNFERACKSSDLAHSRSPQLSNMQFALQLLDGHNDAVGSPPKIDLTQPFAHYWTAASHNTYCVGDQLTGLSSADMYRRQLLQGGRQAEIDLWDGNRRPIVTHGNTFCTVTFLTNVVEAIAECAFVTSELPVRTGAHLAESRADIVCAVCWLF